VKLPLLSQRKAGGMTIVETMVAMGVGTVIMAAFTIASVALQRS
jgi:hypothetical protein